VECEDEFQHRDVPSLPNVPPSKGGSNLALGSSPLYTSLNKSPSSLVNSPKL
jgi:hypothetical protein